MSPLEISFVLERAMNTADQVVGKDATTTLILHLVGNLSVVRGTPEKIRQMPLVIMADNVETTPHHVLGDDEDPGKAFPPRGLFLEPLKHMTKAAPTTDQAIPLSLQLLATSR